MLKPNVASAFAARLCLNESRGVVWCRLSTIENRQRGMQGEVDARTKLIQRLEGIAALAKECDAFRVLVDEAMSWLLIDD